MAEPRNRDEPLITDYSDVLDGWTEGDARIEMHARACRQGGCGSSCRCWCHGITLHLNGSARADWDAPAAIHLRDHLTDGIWHDDCKWCMWRRVHGGTGVR